MAFNILHLSDLHFDADNNGHAFDQDDTDKHKPSMADAVEEVLEGTKVDCLVLSGDFFTRKQNDDLRPAISGITELLDKLKLKGSQVLCVPGNHDVQWKAPHDKRFFWYETLVRQIGARGLKPSVEVFLTGSKPVAFVLMNSCQLEGEKMSGYGLVGDKQLRDLALLIKSKHISGASHHVFGVLHHHLLPLWRAYRVYDASDPVGGEPARYSMTADAGQVMTKLREWGAIGALHGHQHYPAIVAHRDDLERERELRVFAAGSVAAKASKEEEFNRNFFLYQISDASLDVIQYNQDRKDPEKFHKSTKHRAFPLANAAAHKAGYTLEQAPRADGVCKIEQHTEIAQAEEGATGDHSDLYYLFLNVVDCAQARAAIKRVARGIVAAPSWMEDSYFVLIGMYDLLGRWDLAVRFRTNINADKHFVKAVKHDLLRSNLVTRTGEFGVGHMELCNIAREGKGMQDLLRPGAPSMHKRSFMHNTDGYEAARCQRGFVRISLPPKGRHKFLNALARVIEASHGSDIIELMCLKENTLFLEVFMRCSQTHLIAQLNRDVEGVLTKFKCQKSTMLCYGYDEEPVPFRKARATAQTPKRRPTRTT